MLSNPLLRPLVLSSMLAACSAGEPPPREPSPPAKEDSPAPPAAAPSTATPAAARPPPEAPPPAPADAPREEEPKLVGANLSMGSLEADGVRLERVSCKVENGLGLVGAVVLAAGFSKRKAQLEACAPTALARTSVAWTASGGAIAKVTASGPDAKINRCVEKALLGAPAPMPATCVATLVHGKFTAPR